MNLGQQFYAGIGVSTVLADFDFETYSEAGFVWNEVEGKWDGPPGAAMNQKGLGVVGTINYVRHPSFELLCLAYDLKDGLGARHWRPGLPAPTDLFAYLAAGGIIEAWNVAFEYAVWTEYCVPALGWPPLRVEQLRCAMAKARAHALPGKLAKAGEVMNLAIQKDSDGDRLLKIFSVPRKPTQADPRTRIRPLPDDMALSLEALVLAPSWVTPSQRRKGEQLLREQYEDTFRLFHYNTTDIAAEADASIRIPDLDPDELQWWQDHERINRRGVHIDLQGVDDCIEIIEQAHRKYHTELQTLTGIDSATKVQQLLGWLSANGVHTNSLDEEAVEGLLKRNDLEPIVRRVLEIRAAVGSASVKKVFAMRNRVTAESRLVDLYIYHGARTGRSTGEGPQPTNLPKAGPDVVRCGVWNGPDFVEGSGCKRHYAPVRLACPWCGRSFAPPPPGAKNGRIVEWNPDAAEDALTVLRTRSLAWVEYVMGDAMATIAGAVRALFDAAPGHDLISTDFNSIEAVGLAMLAGEQWRIKVFRTHGKIYEASASLMFSVPFEEFAAHKKRTGQHHPLRQKGKVGELGFGYGGWVGAAAAFGMPGTEDEIKRDILAWRAASPAVEWFWGGQTVGKAAGIVQNALKPDYDGTVADAHRAYAGEDRWDRTPLLFGVEGAFAAALSSPGTVYPVYRLDGSHSGVSFEMRGDAIYCRLPSGRPLTYHRPRTHESDRGGVGFSYEGWNTNPKNGPVGWIRMSTWGGRLVENINQATCREFLRAAVRNLEAANYPVVLHVYDEIVSEIPTGYGDIESFERLCVEHGMSWAADWPVRAPGGYRARRYRKG